MGRRMAEMDWASSPLGPPGEWPDELVTAVATMLASGAQIMIFFGPEYCALYNDAYIPVTGSKHPDFLGQPARAMWAETYSLLEDLFGRVHRTGSAYFATDHQFMVERHGFLEETYFDISYDPIRRSDDVLSGIFCIVSETTFRVIGERRVRTLSALGSRLAGAGDESAMIAEAAAVLGENRADLPFARLILDPAAMPPGVREAAMNGHGGTIALREIVADPPPTAADQALVLPVMVGASVSGVLVVGVSRLLALDRSYRDFLQLAVAQLSRAVANLRAYELERSRVAELAALDHAKTAFFSNVSHEFRTPLTLILGPLEDLLDDPRLPAADRERLLPMQRNGMRLLKLVNTMLDFSRLESGRMDADYRPTDLADYTARLASTFRSAAERAGLELVVDTPPLPEPVYVDREMWEKIVLNLLSNAVKFTAAGTIELRMWAEEGRAVLAVRDTGVGVPAAECALLFERFHRVTGAWSRTHEGTGIGLALVRELAVLHGGREAA
jgi:signal transduction histidine kinase